MLRVTIKGLLAHKLRLALTTISVVLGVAFIAGTLVLTDTLNRTFDNLFGDAERNTSVAVRSHSEFTNSESNDRAPVPASLLRAVRQVPGVKEAAGTVDGYAQLIDPRDGKVIANGQAPGLGAAWTDTSLSTLTLTEGRGPAGADEIAIDTKTAEKHHLTVGATVTALVQTGPRTEQIAGIFRFGSSGNLAGATLTAFDLATAQQVLGQPGLFSAIEAAADSGVSQSTLRDRVAQVLPAGVEAITGKALAAENANAIQDDLQFFNIFLLVFAVIALFVGSFIIFNTFTMLVAQRTRELALLRAVGASRRQVTRTVLGEAFVVGVVASTVGLLAGFGIALLLQVLLNAIGGGLSTGGLVLTPKTVYWSYAVGILVTLAAAYGPARRAAKIPPVAALRDDVALPESSLRRRAIIGSVLGVGGIVLLVSGLTGAGSQPAALVGIGASLIFWGVRSLSPFISRPFVRVIGSPMARLRGTAGRLAKENALRNPRRTAATAAALMVGLALVSAMTVMASSVKKSANDVIDSSVGADFVIATNSFTPFNTGVARQLRDIQGVDAVTSFRIGTAKIDGGGSELQGVETATVSKTLNLDITSGRLAALDSGALLIDDKTAKSKNWRVGELVDAVFQRTGATTLEIGGIFKQNQIAGSYLMGIPTFEKFFPRSLDLVVAVKAAEGAPLEQVRTEIEQTAKAAAPNVVVRDQTEFKAEQRKQINQVLLFVTALLGLSVLIAVLGIVNTLALSVFERTREIGLLRAVGMSRRQVRSMVRLESVIIAVFGAVLGIVVGIGFGWAIVTALKDQGIGTLVIPGGQLIAYVVIAALVGVLAAIGPARRAARLDVLHAISAQ